MSSCNPWPASEKKVHKIQKKGVVIVIVITNKPWAGMSKMDIYDCNLS